MSYDLRVYTVNALDLDALRELIASAGLDVESEGHGVLTVTRGKSKIYTFSLEAAQALEPEDIPEEVAAAVLSPRYLFGIGVEGSSTQSIPHAVKVARRVAQAGEGVVLDEQTGQMWSRGASRAVPRVERGVTSVIELHWYAREGFDARAHALAWTRLARRLLPEAVPRRYGAYEPLPERYAAPDGDSELAAFVGAEAIASEGFASSVYFDAHRPLLGGNFATGSGRGVCAHGLTVLRDSFEDPRWRDALRQFFVAFAVETDCILAIGEVRRGLAWNGRSIGYHSGSEPCTYLAARGHWAGLPPYPVWWAWFGREYAPLVERHIEPQYLETAGAGLFHCRVDAPADRDTLAASLRPRRRAIVNRFLPSRLRPADEPWLPARLMPVVDHSCPNVHNPPLTPAVSRPSTLA